MEENTGNFFIRQAKKLTVDLLVLIVLFIACLTVLFIVADMVFKYKNTAFDDHIFLLIAPYINDRNTKIASVITFFGSQYFLLPANIFLAGIFLFFKNHRWYTLRIVAVYTTSTAVLFLLKDLLKRQRPLVPVIAKAHGYSFPSGHTFSSLVFFGMLAYLVHKTIKNTLLRWTLISCCFLFAFLVGFSRVYLKVHYPSDVIAGFCLGIIWLLLAKWLLIKTEKAVAK